MCLVIVNLESLPPPTDNFAFFQNTTMKVLIFLLPLVASMSLPLEHDFSKDEAWIEWKLTHGKFYKDHKEESVRRAIWGINLQEILRHNAEGKHSYKKGLNHFSDLVSSDTLHQLR